MQYEISMLPSHSGDQLPPSAKPTIFIPMPIHNVQAHITKPSKSPAQTDSAESTLEQRPKTRSSKKHLTWYGGLEIKETITFSNTLAISVFPENKPTRHNTDLELMLNAFQSPMPVLKVDGDDSPALKRDFAGMSSMISTRMSTEASPVNRKYTIDANSHINQFSIQEFKIAMDDLVVNGGSGGDANLKDKVVDDDADGDDKEEKDNNSICHIMCENCHAFFSHIGAGLTVCF